MPNDFTIIVTDDDIDDQLFIADALERRGFSGEIKFMNNGEKLISHLKEMSNTALIGLILLDLNMPFMNGFEALKILKQDGVLKSIPVVVLTSSPSSETEKQCYALGADNFYHKPLSLEGYDKVADKIVAIINP